MSIGEIKPGMAIIYNKELYVVSKCNHVKMGRGAAFCKAKIKNLKNSQVLECTLRDSDNLEKAFIEKRKLQYLYCQGDFYHFMDLQTYDDLIFSKLQIGDRDVLLKDDLEVIGHFHENSLIDFEFPNSLDLKVMETTPGHRGDTVKMGTKSAKLETGLIINVPLFININDTIKVNTQTREYLGRA